MVKSATSEFESRQSSSLNAKLKLELVTRVLAQHKMSTTKQTASGPVRLTPALDHTHQESRENLREQRKA